jgi:hemolysin III
VTPAPYTRGEERAHVVTHAAGLLASLVAIPWLAIEGLRAGDAWKLAGALVFAGTAALLFGTSCLYHSAVRPEIKSRRRLLDHSAIYLLIAGTYTPFALGVIRESAGWWLFGVIWALAVAGIASKLAVGFRYPRLSTALYVGMGWAGVSAAGPLADALTSGQLAWVLAGGIAYTAGVPFYLMKRTRYTHAAWHVFVLAGVGCHFIAVLGVLRTPAGAG